MKVKTLISLLNKVLEEQGNIEVLYNQIQTGVYPEVSEFPYDGFRRQIDIRETFYELESGGIRRFKAAVLLPNYDASTDSDDAHVFKTYKR